MTEDRRQRAKGIEGGRRNSECGRFAETMVERFRVQRAGLTNSQPAFIKGIFSSSFL
jgi:hypothetical protein